MARDDDPSVEEVRRLLNTPIEKLAEGEGVVRLCNTVAQAINSMRGEGRNAAGLQLIERFGPLLFEFDHEESRRGVWDSEVILLRNWLSEGDPPVATAANPHPAQRKPTAKDKRIAKHLTTALRSGQTDREVEGLKALHDAIELDRSLLDRHGRAFAWLQ